MGTKEWIRYSILEWVGRIDCITVRRPDLWLIDSSPVLHSVTKILETNIGIGFKITPINSKVATNYID